MCCEYSVIEGKGTYKNEFSKIVVEHFSNLELISEASNRATQGRSSHADQWWHSGGRGRLVSEFKATLVYRANSRTSWLHRETLSAKTKTLHKYKCSVAT